MPNFFLGGDQSDSIKSQTSSAKDFFSGIASKYGFTTEVETFEKTAYTEKKTMTYPFDINSTTNHPNFFMFRAYNLTSTTRSYYGEMRTNFTQNQNSDFTKNQSSVSELKTTIALYAPNLIEEVTHDYDKTPTSVASDFIAQSSGAVSEVLAGEVTAAGTTVGKAAKTAAGATTAQIQRGLLSKTRAGTLAKNSTVVNDSVSVTAYKGTSLRTQTFLYNFYPNSEAELKEVADIIKTFYSLSLPEKTQFGNAAIDASNDRDTQEGYSKYATAYKTPPVWFIEEVSNIDNDKRYTPRFIFGPAGITSVKLNKTPDQYWRTFSGTAGDSAAIEMEISFTELIPMTRQIYDADQSSAVSGYVR